ncbi:piRNA biogenesis protein EXD1 [Araneus ventricosus]|uniref:PiRNA biogenesis protein EXD1 n=1 Tax=Araneus ventricosus TaxID=182803 RepID=A0A4Y2J4I2_ARAVE|nr:piRNA biogenesis protein EXD1 [Araneus ventricosus]
MTSVEDLLDALNCIIRFTTPEGEYEGVLKRVFVPSQMVTVGKILLLPSKTKLGTLNFMFHEVSNVKILKRPDTPIENDDETSLIYFRPDIDGVFNLDGNSETESEFNINEISNEEEFVMKLLPCFSKWISSDSQIIDMFNNEFRLAIKLISSEGLIAVSLEGPKISRNGILTWLCISTTSCTYLFDILALGKRSFQNGLKSILENSKIKKIFHDCRLASDCLFHVYNVRLINVFDTQVADSLVMMQESKNCSIIKQVNSLDTCLSYYLQLPDDYLYSPLTFSLDKRSSYYHGLRPLRHSFRCAMIKNVIYLRLLKRELETALLTPLRRATDVYLNVIQNATDCELMVAPPVMDELPPELLLEGIQIVRYQQYEYIPPIVSSGPPYRKLVNPIKDFIECCRKFQSKEEIKCLPSEDYAISQNMEAEEFSSAYISNEACTNSSQFSRDFSKRKYISCQRNTDNAFNVNESDNTQNSVLFPQRNDSDYVCFKESLMNEMTQDVSVGKKTVFNKMPSVFGDLSIKMEQSNAGEKNCVKIFIDPSAEGEKVGGKMHVTSNTCITDYTASSVVRLPEKGANEVVKNSFSHENSHLSENECKVSNPVGNCLLRPLSYENSSSHENSHLSGNENECKVSNPVGNCLLRPFNEMSYENSFSHENSHLSGNENECKVSNPVGNCLLRPFNEMPYENSFSHENSHLSEVSNPDGNCLLEPFNKMSYEKNLGSTMIASKLFSDNSKMLLGQERKLNNQPIAYEDFWNEIRKEFVTQQSNDDQNDCRPKIRFVPAGMAGI